MVKVDKVNIVAGAFIFIPANHPDSENLDMDDITTVFF